MFCFFRVFGNGEKKAASRKGERGFLLVCEDILFADSFDRASRNAVQAFDAGIGVNNRDIFIVYFDSFGGAVAFTCAATDAFFGVDSWNCHWGLLGLVKNFVSLFETIGIIVCFLKVAIVV